MILIILLPGSDYHNFFYKAPLEYLKSKFQINILNYIDNKSERDFIIDAYSEKSQFDDRIRLKRLVPDDYTKLYKIIEKNKLQLKTANWFKILTEENIVEDFLGIDEKMDEVSISFENLLKIPMDLGLNEIDI